jgi:hypothetical protein
MIKSSSSMIHMSHRAGELAGTCSEVPDRAITPEPSVTKGGEGKNSVISTTQRKRKKSSLLAKGSFLHPCPTKHHHHNISLQHRPLHRSFACDCFASLRRQLPYACHCQNSTSWPFQTRPDRSINGQARARRATAASSLRFIPMITSSS